MNDLFRLFPDLSHLPKRPIARRVQEVREKAARVQHRMKQVIAQRQKAIEGLQRAFQARRATRRRK